MTNEEAKLTVDYLKEMQEEYIEGEGYERHPLPEWYALDKAIELLEQQPSDDSVFKNLWAQVKWERDVAIEQLEQLGYSLGEKIRTSEDCISRKSVVEWLERCTDDSIEHAIDSNLDFIPSVTPQQRVGKWINGNPICPCCGEDKFKDLDADIWADWQPKYCPNCGAKMEVEG